MVGGSARGYEIHREQANDKIHRMEIGNLWHTRDVEQKWGAYSSIKTLLLHQVLNLILEAKAHEGAGRGSMSPWPGVSASFTSRKCLTSMDKQLPPLG